MSDLSVILNALFTQNNSKSYHYQLMNLVSSDGAEQQRAFYRTFFEGQNDLYDFRYHWVRGNQMSGIVIGEYSLFFKAGRDKLFSGSFGQYIIVGEFKWQS